MVKSPAHGMRATTSLKRTLPDCKHLLRQSESRIPRRDVVTIPRRDVLERLGGSARRRGEHSPRARPSLRVPRKNSPEYFQVSNLRIASKFAFSIVFCSTIYEYRNRGGFIRLADDETRDWVFESTLADLAKIGNGAIRPCFGLQERRQVSKNLAPRVGTVFRAHFGSILSLTLYL